MIFFLAIFTAVLLQGYYVSGTDIEIIRDSCFKNEEKNCDADFVEVRKDLSRSKTGKLADTYFLLYTRRNPDEPEKLHKCAGRLPPGSNFNKNKRIILITLSFLSDFCELEVYREWKDEILKREDANVIAIDYNWNFANYQDAHENLRLVADQTVVILNNIKEQTGAPKLSIMIIGISLGAHLAAYIGEEYDVERIIGLDPAGPLFDKAPDSERLDPSDAAFVDVWHCNAGDYGADYDAGHVNYYINGGKYQESCRETSVKSILKGDIFYAAGTLYGPTCSHLQCTQYFKESINPEKCQYAGVKCSNYEELSTGSCSSCGPNGENCLIMGFDADKVIKEIPQAPQRFYLKTKSEAPFCDNDYVDLDGYEATYKSVLQKKSSGKKEEKSVLRNLFDEIRRWFTHIFT